MTASYNIVPVLRTPEVNPGGEVRVDVYISGAGTFRRRRLHILHPYPDLFKENVGTLSPGIAMIPADEVEDDVILHGEDTGSGYVARPRKEVDEEYQTVNEQDSIGATIAIPNWMFQEIPGEMVEDTGTRTGEGSPPTFPLKLFEGKWGESAPFELTLKVSPDADPGTYEITNLFTYETEYGIKTTRKTVEFRVNDWVEQRQPQLKRAIVAVALIGLLIQTIGFIISFI